MVHIRRELSLGPRPEEAAEAGELAVDESRKSDTWSRKVYSPNNYVQITTTIITSSPDSILFSNSLVETTRSLQHLWKLPLVVACWKAHWSRSEKHDNSWIVKLRSAQPCTMALSGSVSDEFLSFFAAMSSWRTLLGDSKDSERYDSQCCEDGIHGHFAVATWGRLDARMDVRQSVWWTCDMWGCINDHQCTCYLSLYLCTCILYLLYRYR